MKTVTIKIDKKTIDAILMLNNRYYFNLFESIRNNIEEEHELRDAIDNIATKIRDVIESKKA